MAASATTFTVRTRLITRRDYTSRSSLAEILADIARDGHGGQLIVIFNDGGVLNSASWSRPWRGEKEDGS